MTDPSGSMTCPVDGTALTMSERLGIEIDYCPKCRGVWLDRGELDKIIERGSAAPQSGSQQAAPPPQAPQGYYDRGHHGSGFGHHGRRRKSFLHDLFD